MRSNAHMLRAGFVIILILVGGSAWSETMEKRSDEGIFAVTLNMAPQQPIVGNNTVTLTIRDARSGTGIEKAVIEVIPWMTIHGHGSSKKTSVVESRGGLYTVRDVYFTMAGTWDLMVNIKKNGKKDSLIFTVKNVAN